MQEQRTGNMQIALVVVLILGAGLLGYAVATLSRGRSDTGQQTASASAPAANQSITPEMSVAAVASVGPTPTFVPIGPRLDVATPSPPALPSATPEPSVASPAPTNTPVPPAPEVPVRSNRSVITLDDTVWQGSFRQSRGYGGRSATWIYGIGTEYSSMQATFNLDSAASGVALLTIEGMDSEDRAKTPIRISVNRRTIFEGPNPLPNDDLPLNSGTWASVVFEFDAAVLQAGSNTIRIDNLKPGSFSLPPFFMLDYATISYTPA